MACCSPAKTEHVGSKKAETVNAVAAEANAFADSTWCLTPRAALRRSFTVTSRRSSKLRTHCAEVRSCSWSQHEGSVSDRKTGMRCKRVVDHEIPSLASPLSQG
jgi:hypothetical protein